MPTAREYYFLRANGHTVHNDPARPDCFVAGEPPELPKDAYDHAGYCLRYDVARLGWPGVGDLRLSPDVPAEHPCYGSLPERVRDYLRLFKHIDPGAAGVLLPDKSRPGVVYAGDVTIAYSYFHLPPDHPFECAHRVGVRWDRDHGVPVEYHAEELGIPTRGGWWLWPFHHLTPDRHAPLIERVNARRALPAQASPP